MPVYQACKRDTAPVPPAEMPPDNSFANKDGGYWRVEGVEAGPSESSKTSSPVGQSLGSLGALPSCHLRCHSVHIPVCLSLGREWLEVTLHGDQRWCSLVPSC